VELRQRRVGRQSRRAGRRRLPDAHADDHLFNGTGSNSDRKALAGDASPAITSIFGSSVVATGSTSRLRLDHVQYLRLNGVNVPPAAAWRLDAVYASAAPRLSGRRHAVFALAVTSSRSAALEIRLGRKVWRVQPYPGFWGMKEELNRKRFTHCWLLHDLFLWPPTWLSPTTKEPHHDRCLPSRSSLVALMLCRPSPRRWSTIRSKHAEPEGFQGIAIKRGKAAW